MSKSVSRSTVRPGEVATVPIHRRLVAQTGEGAETVELGLDLERAPVPPRRYTADVIAVRLEDENVHLLFGQRKLVGTGVRSLVVVELSFEAARAFLRASEDMLAKLRQFVTDRRIPRPRPLDMGSEEPGQVVVLTVNVIAAAQVSREACLDMYNLSPFSLRTFGRDTQELAIDPVLRVDLTAGALLTMLEEMVALAPRLPEDASKGKRE